MNRQKVKTYSRPSEITGYLPLGASTDPPAGPAAVYVHFPFCRYLCTYCDFDTFTGMEPLIASYMLAVSEQVRASPRVTATSIYVGGGTPSMMSPRQGANLLEACRGRFALSPEAEATLEANPSGLTSSTLAGFRSGGFNRLSIGVQSSDERLLRLLGRRHSREDARATIAAAREAGFGNLSVDLIYGVPAQSVESWARTLETVIDWGVEHISCYMLTLEEGTPLSRGVARGSLVLPSEDEAVAMYGEANRILGEAGYRRYEISNWARPGFESEHNMTYWRAMPYIAIGAGAAGYLQDRRYKLSPDAGRYIAGVRTGAVPLSENEAVGRRRGMSEMLILGLRLTEGVSREAYQAHFRREPEEDFEEALEWGEREGILERNSQRLRLTERGILLSNELFERLL